MILPLILHKSNYKEFANHLLVTPYTIYCYIENKTTFKHQHSFKSINEILNLLNASDFVIATRSGSKSTIKYIFYHATISILNTDTLIVNTIFIEDVSNMEKMLLAIIHLLLEKKDAYKTLIFPFTVDIDIVENLTDYYIFYDIETSCTIVKRNTY